MKSTILDFDWLLFGLAAGICLLIPFLLTLAHSDNDDDDRTDNEEHAGHEDLEE